MANSAWRSALASRPNRNVQGSLLLSHLVHGCKVLAFRYQLSVRDVQAVFLDFGACPERVSRFELSLVGLLGVPRPMRGERGIDVQAGPNLVPSIVTSK